MNKEWASDFSYNYFNKLLKAAKKNFEFALFSEASLITKSKKKLLFLRHDIDIDLGKALQMGKIEHQAGVRSTYMVMLNAPTYDISEIPSRAILQELILLGHEIGLHFDLDINNRNNVTTIESIASMIYKDLVRLEDIIQKPVKSLSFHRPLSQLLKGPFTIAGRINAYSAELMNWYLSDSAGRWREGEPLPKLESPGKNILQLLIHPIWWDNEHAPATERLEVYFTTKTKGWLPENIEKLDKTLSNHISVRRSGLKKSEKDEYTLNAGKFNTDAAALTRRIESHGKYGSNDLNKWIFEHVNIVKGSSVLDLGCGTGKQTIPAAHLTGESGHVIAIDTSEKALQLLIEKAVQEKVEDRIITKCSNFNQIDSLLTNLKFDFALACYSLYYSDKPKELLEAVYTHLNKEGAFFFCGPAKNNNAELKLFHQSLLPNKSMKETGPAIFMEETGSALAQKIFDKVEYYTFENPLRFDSADSLYNYWSAYNLYDENIDTAFKKAAFAYFEQHSFFETIKRVIGVKVIKQ